VTVTSTAATESGREDPLERVQGAAEVDERIAIEGW
jgi:hypothetical protein